MTNGTDRNGARIIPKQLHELSPFFHGGSFLGHLPTAALSLEATRILSLITRSTHLYSWWVLVPISFSAVAACDRAYAPYVSILDCRECFVIQDPLSRSLHHHHVHRKFAINRPNASLIENAISAFRSIFRPLIFFCFICRAPGHVL